jgi:hypothetical protein
VGRSAGGHDDRLRPEDVKIPVPDAEADGAGDPVGTRLVHQQMRHHDPVVHFGGGLPGGLGDDRLVTLAVDHDLPATFSQVPAGHLVPHDRQAPLLELVHRGVDVPGDVEAQVLAHQTHQVISRIAHMVLRPVLVPLHAHIAVDRRQAVRHRAAALDVRLFDEDDLQVPPPVPGFVRGPAAAKATADDEDVRIHEPGFSG